MSTCESRLFFFASVLLPCSFVAPWCAGQPSVRIPLSHTLPLCSVRMERLRELREEASARLKSGALSHTGADPPQLATALELAGIRPEAPPPEIRLSKRRKVADTLAMLEEQGGDSDNEEEEEGEGEGAAMDWRSKSTA